METRGRFWCLNRSPVFGFFYLQHLTTRQHEGGFAFGRPISEAEAKAVSLDETLDELSAFIEAYDRLPITPRTGTR